MLLLHFIVSMIPAGLTEAGIRRIFLTMLATKNYTCASELEQKLWFYAQRLQNRGWTMTEWTVFVIETADNRKIIFLKYENLKCIIRNKLSLFSV